MGQQIFQACNSLLTSIFKLLPALYSYEMIIFCVCVCACVRVCACVCLFHLMNYPTNFHETLYEKCNIERPSNNVFSNFLKSVENNMVDATFCEVLHY